MMISKNHFFALKIISERINGKIPYALIGSTNLALHGIDISPNDIDLVTTIEDMHRCRELFSEYIPVITDVAVIKTPYNTHYALIFSISNVTIEISSEDAGGIYDSLFKENAILYPEDSFIDVEDILIPCFSLKSELKAYSLTGRKEKAHLIERFLNKR